MAIDLASNLEPVLTQMYCVSYKQQQQLLITNQFDIYIFFQVALLRTKYLPVLKMEAEKITKSSKWSDQVPFPSWYRRLVTKGFRQFFRQGFEY